MHLTKMRIIKYNVDVKIIRKDDCKLQIYGIDLKVYFLLFIIYAVIGWCMEVICKLIQYKKFVDRGIFNRSILPNIWCRCSFNNIFLK